MVDQLKEALAGKVRGDASDFSKPHKYLLQGVPGNVSAKVLVAALGRLCPPIQDVTVVQNKKSKGGQRDVVIRSKDIISRRSFPVAGGPSILIKAVPDKDAPEQNSKYPVTAVMPRPASYDQQDTDMIPRITTFAEAVRGTSAKMQNDIEKQLESTIESRMQNVAQTCATNEIQRISKTVDDQIQEQGRAIQTLAASVSHLTTNAAQLAERSAQEMTRTQEREQLRDQKLDERLQSMVAGMETQNTNMTQALVGMSTAVAELGAGAAASRDLILNLGTRQGASDAAVVALQKTMENLMAGISPSSTYPTGSTLPGTNEPPLAALATDNNGQAGWGTSLTGNDFIFQHNSPDQAEAGSKGKGKAKDDGERYKPN